MPTPLITAKGFALLQTELKQLWQVERPKITEKVAWAASLGDRSENADYKENKRKLRTIDKRIRYLQKRLEQLKVVEFHPSQLGKVFFGAIVFIENDQGERKKFQIVGYDEIFNDKTVISIDSPMAKALIGKSVDDEIEVNTPQGLSFWQIKNIEYKQ